MGKGARNKRRSLPRKVRIAFRYRGEDGKKRLLHLEKHQAADAAAGRTHYTVSIDHFALDKVEPQKFGGALTPAIARELREQFHKKNPHSRPLRIQGISHSGDVLPTPPPGTDPDDDDQPFIESHAIVDIDPTQLEEVIKLFDVPADHAVMAYEPETGTTQCLSPQPSAYQQVHKQGDTYIAPQITHQNDIAQRLQAWQVNPLTFLKNPFENVTNAAAIPEANTISAQQTYLLASWIKSLVQTQAELHKTNQSNSATAESRAKEYYLQQLLAPLKIQDITIDTLTAIVNAIKQENAATNNDPSSVPRSARNKLTSAAQAQALIDIYKNSVFFHREPPHCFEQETLARITKFKLESEKAKETHDTKKEKRLERQLETAEQDFLWREFGRLNLLTQCEANTNAPPGQHPLTPAQQSRLIQLQNQETAATTGRRAFSNKDQFEFALLEAIEGGHGLPTILLPGQPTNGLTYQDYFNRLTQAHAENCFLHAERRARLLGLPVFVDNKIISNSSLAAEMMSDRYERDPKGYDKHITYTENGLRIDEPKKGSTHPDSLQDLYRIQDRAIQQLADTLGEHSPIIRTLRQEAQMRVFGENLLGTKTYVTAQQAANTYANLRLSEFDWENMRADCRHAITDNRTIPLTPRAFYNTLETHGFTYKATNKWPESLSSLFVNPAATTDAKKLEQIVSGLTGSTTQAQHFVNTLNDNAITHHLDSKTPQTLLTDFYAYQGRAYRQIFAGNRLQLQSTIFSLLQRYQYQHISDGQAGSIPVDQMTLAQIADLSLDKLTAGIPENLRAAWRNFIATLNISEHQRTSQFLTDMIDDLHRQRSWHAIEQARNQGKYRSVDLSDPAVIEHIDQNNPGLQPLFVSFTSNQDEINHILNDVKRRLHIEAVKAIQARFQPIHERLAVFKKALITFGLYNEFAGRIPWLTHHLPSQLTSFIQSLQKFKGKIQDLKKRLQLHHKDETNESQKVRLAQLIAQIDDIAALDVTEETSDPDLTQRLAEHRQKLLRASFAQAQYTENRLGSHTPRALTDLIADASQKITPTSSTKVKAASAYAQETLLQLCEAQLSRSALEQAHYQALATNNIGGYQALVNKRVQYTGEMEAGVSELDDIKKLSDDIAAGEQDATASQENYTEERKKAYATREDELKKMLFAADCDAILAHGHGNLNAFYQEFNNIYLRKVSEFMFTIRNFDRPLSADNKASLALLFLLLFKLLFEAILMGIAFASKLASKNAMSKNYTGMILASLQKEGKVNLNQIIPDPDRKNLRSFFLHNKEGDVLSRTYRLAEHMRFEVAMEALRMGILPDNIVGWQSLPNNLQDKFIRASEQLSPNDFIKPDAVRKYAMRDIYQQPVRAGENIAKQLDGTLRLREELQRQRNPYAAKRSSGKSAENSQQDQMQMMQRMMATGGR